MQYVSASLCNRLALIIRVAAWHGPMPCHAQERHPCRIHAMQAWHGRRPEGGASADRGSWGALLTHRTAMSPWSLPSPGHPLTHSGALSMPYPCPAWVKLPMPCHAQRAAIHAMKIAWHGMERQPWFFFNRITVSIASRRDFFPAVRRVRN